jgi:hypothetical protein
LSAKRAVWDENVTYYPLRVFMNNDFMYLFLHNNQIHLVLPDELLEIFREVSGDEGFKSANARMLELSAYAAAMINLYGAYDFEYYVNVWNQHRKDKITLGETRVFLSLRAYFNSDFYFIDDYVVHDCLFDDDFEELLENSEDVDYFMPTKSIIREYAAKGHDDSKIPGQREMEDFLAGYFKDDRMLEELQFEIVDSCVRLKSPPEVRALLTAAKAPLGDNSFCAKFESLYNTLRDNTHIWELCGHTPHQYEIETGKSIPRFALPKPKKKKV